MAHIFEAQQRLCRGQTQTQIDAWDDWLALGLQDDQLVWRKATSSGLNAPFFADHFLHQAPSQRLIHLQPLARSPEHYSGYSALPLHAMVFHSSRCGSTLLMQMLASDTRFLALSEPPLFDAALSSWLHGQISQTDFCHAIHALCLKRDAEIQYPVIKTDSWHLPQLPLLRQLFTKTPMLFLFREPAEILASHARQTGPQMIPGMLDLTMLGLQNHSEHWDFHSWPDFFLTHLYELAAVYQQSYGLKLINYSDLPEALWQTLLPDWQISCNEAQLSAMQQRSQRHAKSGQNWQGDPQTRPCPVSPRLRSAYQRLQELAALPTPTPCPQTQTL